MIPIELALVGNSIHELELQKIESSYHSQRLGILYVLHSLLLIEHIEEQGGINNVF